MSTRLINGSAAWLLLWTGLLLLVLWTGWTCWLLREEAILARDHVAASQELGQRILTLRSAPATVEEKVHTSEALARLVETAAQKGNMNPDRIVDIAPNEPRRIGETPYLEQSTNIEVREAPMQQIVEFTIALSNSGIGIEVPSLSFRVPAGKESEVNNNQELWNAHLVLTSRIYAPKIPSSQSPP